MLFLSMKLSNIIAITNSNGESASPLKMPLSIFPRAVNSTFQFSIASVINFMTFLDILNILR